MRAWPLLWMFACAPADDAETLFDALWTDFDTLYGPFAQRGVDWDAAGARWRPIAAEGDAWAAATGLLTELDDGHVKLVAPGHDLFQSNHVFRDRPDDRLFDLDAIRRGILDTWESGPHDSWTFGTLAPGVTYLHLPYVADNVLVLDRILEERPGDALVLDLRHNSGGDFTWAFEAFGRLTDRERPVFRSRTRNGPERSDFTDWEGWSLTPRGRHDDRPIVLLTDRYTISAGERAVLALRQLPQVVHLGEATNGAQATMIARRLPAGWVVSLPVQEVEEHDGAVWEGIGVPPHEVVRCDEEELARGHDAMLARALEILSDR